MTDSLTTFRLISSIHGGGTALDSSLLLAQHTTKRSPAQAAGGVQCETA